MRTVALVLILWTLQTFPSSGEDAADAEKLAFVERKSQAYNVTFAARPDDKRFQIVRSPTAKWPKRESLILTIGESSVDQQIRLESFTEKESVNKAGIRVDTSVLEVTFLPTGQAYQLVRGVATEIPTYFAELEFLLEPGKTFYVKEGKSFSLASDPNTKYRVEKVEETTVTIAYPGKDAKEKTIKIEKKAREKK